MSPKKAVILCYSFPPFPGIGGRRWAKFSKYLSKNNNINLFIVGAENRGIVKSNWTKDVLNDENIKYYPVASNFYKFYHDQFKGTFGKIWFKFCHFCLKFKYKGNYFDKSLSSLDLFYEKTKELLLKHEIKNLIVTIAPYRLVEVGVRLKNEFPDLNFIIDVRDPWNILLEDWDHKHLNAEQKAFELERELEAVTKADAVFSVCQIVLDFYKSKIPQKQNLIFLPNGYDVDEVSISNHSLNPDRIKYFLYAGILYDTSINLFEEFVQQIVVMQKETPDLLNEIQFHFYISDRGMFKNVVDKYRLDNIKFFDHVPLPEIQNVIANSIGCMLFLPPKFEFSLSTKFYEYISHNKKLLVFTNPGEVGNIVQQYNLGYVMHPGAMKNQFKLALKELNEPDFIHQHTFNITNYSVEKLAEVIIPYLQ